MKIASFFNVKIVDWDLGGGFKIMIKRRGKHVYKRCMSRNSSYKKGD